MMEGTDKLEKRLLEMRKVNLRNGIQKGIETVQHAAKEACPRRDGELQSHIFIAMEEEGYIVRGICWPDPIHGMYVELGTGPKGQAHHEGISPNVTPGYTQKPWWIPEKKGTYDDNGIERETAEFYHFPYIDTPDGRLYYCAGQEARPYLYPALKDNEDRIVEIIASEVKEKIRKV